MRTRYAAGVAALAAVAALALIPIGATAAPTDGACITGRSCAQSRSTPCRTRSTPATRS